MFRMLLIIFLAALLWSAAWFWGGASNKMRITTWISDQQQAGYDIGFSDLSQLGFPNRYDVTVQNPKLSAANPGLDWRADFIQIMRLSYQPNHHILVWPDTQKITFNKRNFDMRHQGLRASVVTRDPGQFRLSTEARDIVISSSGRQWLAAQDLQFSIVETATGVKVYIRLKDVKLDEGAQEGEMRLLFDISGQALGFNGLLPQLRPNETFEVSNIKLGINDVDVTLEGWLSLGLDTGLRGRLQADQKHWQIVKSLLGSALPENQPDKGFSRSGLTIVPYDDATVN